MKYFLIAGEASGDLHGAKLITALTQEDPKAQLSCWGGDLMQQAGATVLKHYRELAFMGFLEVVKNLPTILRNFKICKAQIVKTQPDVLILIDYPGFNLRMAKWAKKQGFRVFYYISPQLWAWHSSRVRQVRNYVDRMFVILPFEKDFYQQYNYEVDFVGHPLLDVVQEYKTPSGFRELHGLEERPVIALLPGSRRQEIRSMLKTMLAVVDDFPDYQFVIAGAPAIPEEFYKDLIKGFGKTSGKASIHLVQDSTYALLSVAKAALVTSGTATLETALFKVPQMVCYRGNPISYQIAKWLIQVNYISLVNLIANKEMVKELIQGDFQPERIREELAAILAGPKREQQLVDYAQLPELLGEHGAAARTARLMQEYLSKEV